ncbi:hypothetical protein [Longimicrobium terrae]|uniref:Glycine zipper domain-containing protein n=1 Tax=Longimicrobium terrae TaxID=1639882 RepID=A0A841H0K1_9BACT|nr:hypothetical protein [Longimicrobium terrae]MBB4637124.1 hypothetical protein [Longimicrobium terrae]MBB6071615.1 hypothetical protein [Longimicrobium terrae]NNC29968.1 hypothetical protein [Longimicrobium terrae]
MKRYLLSACAFAVCAASAVPAGAQTRMDTPPAVISASLQPAVSSGARATDAAWESGRSRVRAGRVVGGVLIGAGAGAVAGGLLGRFAVTDDDEDCQDCLLDFNADDRMAMGAVAGAGVGAVIGGIVAIATGGKSSRAPVAVSRAPAGGTAVSMRLTF